MSFLPRDSLSITVNYESFPWVDLGNAEYGVYGAHTLPEFLPPQRTFDIFYHFSSSQLRK
jgi:hypothetical protein